MLLKTKQIQRLPKMCSCAWKLGLLHQFSFDSNSNVAIYHFLTLDISFILSLYKIKLLLTIISYTNSSCEIRSVSEVPGFNSHKTHPDYATESHFSHQVQTSNFPGSQKDFHWIMGSAFHHKIFGLITCMRRQCQTPFNVCGQHTHN